MRAEFYPELFFDLQECFFTELFEEKNPVWFALKNLKQYIEKHSSGKKESEIPHHTILVHPETITIGKGCKIYPGSYIEGPCILGKEVEVGHCAFIRPYSLLGDFCKIGHATEIKHSIFFNHAKAPHFNYVGDSILGAEVNLGAGVICANYKINKKEVFINQGAKRVPTQMKKFGAVIGDRSSLGCNSVTNPGTLLGKGFLCSPCTNVHGVILT
jgi:NDP-sugar pyrophosphorylase family protein